MMLKSLNYIVIVLLVTGCGELEDPSPNASNTPNNSNNTATSGVEIQNLAVQVFNDTAFQGCDVKAVVDSRNDAAQRLLKKLGFVPEPESRREFFKGEWVEEYCYGLGRDAIA